MSEDCLSLNVICPEQAKAGKLPVAVGGLYSGGSANPSTNLTHSVYQSTLAGKPIIAVSLNYRLTAFGFLSGSPEVSKHGSLNNGLRDQRLALRWIQENIETFGGDPAKVIIWGESSGALSVGKQLIAYQGRNDGLFRGAIMDSGGMVEKWPYNIANATAYGEDLYRNLTATTGCLNETSSLERLRDLPIEQLSAALKYSATPVFAGTGLGPWLTVVDGSVNTDSDFARLIASAGPDEQAIETLEILYPNVNAVGLPMDYHPTASDDAARGVQYKRAVAFLTDAVETSSRRLTLDTWAKANATAYSARLDLIPMDLPSYLGAFHGADLNIVFNNINSTGSNIGSTAYASPQFRLASELMSRSWVSFVHDLNPNGHGVPHVPKWPAWQIENSAEVGSSFVFVAKANDSRSAYVELDTYKLAQTRYINSIWSTQLNY
ncbi:hypothetical protein LTR78_010338 [Recurvomyces mirabilis]|uniref:Carboxylic ester hydrolase n=1 Tax=Recurvomyces mirabilis TaxID=574656 RepID=A0AAE0TLW4_9PEZI|nr:hypothetical protein LTR78_010338 [Recurvomyces mirabilis]KAK5156221.1 hypothetical protein LTS14_005108 [Recurvomyces mirabilis]